MVPFLRFAIEPATAHASQRPLAPPSPRSWSVYHEFPRKIILFLHRQLLRALNMNDTWAIAAVWRQQTTSLTVKLCLIYNSGRGRGRGLARRRLAFARAREVPRSKRELLTAPPRHGLISGHDKQRSRAASANDTH